LRGRGRLRSRNRRACGGYSSWCEFRGRRRSGGRLHPRRFGRSILRFFFRFRRGFRLCFDFGLTLEVLANFFRHVHRD
jgi:hypothetical protein